MPIEIGQALKLIGGAPHLKAGSVIAEKLPITKMLDGGPIGGLLSRALKDGPGALMQNPIAGAAGQLQGAIGGAVGGLGGVLGGGPLITALTGAGGLSAATTAITGAADRLSGVAMPDAGQFGLLDAITHTSVTDMLGDAVPAAMALPQVLGPLNAGWGVASIAGAMPALVRGVVAGTISVADASAWVMAQAAALTATTAASANALQSAQDIAMTLVSISSTAASLASAPAPIQAILPMIVRPDALLAMRAAVASHLTPPDPSPTP